MKRFKSFVAFLLTFTLVMSTFAVNVFAFNPAQFTIERTITMLPNGQLQVVANVTHNPSPGTAAINVGIVQNSNFNLFSLNGRTVGSAGGAILSPLGNFQMLAPPSAGWPAAWSGNTLTLAFSDADLENSTATGTLWTAVFEVDTPGTGEYALQTNISAPTPATVNTLAPIPVIFEDGRLVNVMVPDDTATAGPATPLFSATPASINNPLPISLLPIGQNVPIQVTGLPPGAYRAEAHPDYPLPEGFTVNPVFTIAANGVGNVNIRGAYTGDVLEVDDPVEDIRFIISNSAGDALAIETGLIDFTIKEPQNFPVAGFTWSGNLQPGTISTLTARIAPAGAALADRHVEIELVDGTSSLTGVTATQVGSTVVGPAGTITLNVPVLFPWGETVELRARAVDHETGDPLPDDDGEWHYSNIVVGIDEGGVGAEGDYFGLRVGVNSDGRILVTVSLDENPGIAAFRTRLNFATRTGAERELIPVRVNNNVGPLGPEIAPLFGTSMRMTAIQTDAWNFMRWVNLSFRQTNANQGITDPYFVTGDFAEVEFNINPNWDGGEIEIGLGQPSELVTVPPVDVGELPGETIVIEDGQKETSFDFDPTEPTITWQRGSRDHPARVALDVVSTGLADDNFSFEFESEIYTPNVDPELEGTWGPVPDLAVDNIIPGVRIIDNAAAVPVSTREVSIVRDAGVVTLHANETALIPGTYRVSLNISTAISDATTSWLVITVLPPDGDPRLFGDANADGNVNLADSIRLAQYINDWHLLRASGNNFRVGRLGDVNNDGDIEIDDLTLLTRYLAGWHVDWRDPNNTDWFNPEFMPADGFDEQVITPSLAPWAPYVHHSGPGGGDSLDPNLRPFWLDLDNFGMDDGKVWTSSDALPDEPIWTGPPAPAPPAP